MIHVVLSVVVSLVLAQDLSTPPARIGDAARKLSRQDIVDIERALASAGKTEKPWLLIGGETPQHSYVVYAYLTHESGTAEFRRSEKVMIARPSKKQPWSVYFIHEKSGGTCAQVAVQGQSMDSIVADRDISQPFWVIGDIPDAEITSVVRFLRTAPPTSLYGEQVPSWRIGQLFRSLDGGSISVSLRHPNEYSGISMRLKQDGSTWRILETFHWVS
jgi:hypothetical protein